MKIYDCFQFFNELDLLEIRLEMLYDYVDYFVISETTKTHSNNDKKMYFEDNKEYFKKYLDKIIHIKTDYPEEILNMGLKEGNTEYNTIYNEISFYYDKEEHEGYLKQYPTFCRDYLQREFIKFGLISCEEDDLIMVSDLDEIPNPLVVKKIKEENLYNHCVMQDCFYYYINCMAHTNWFGNYIVKYSETKKSSLTHLRNRRVNFDRLNKSGWHLSFMGGYDRVKTKIESYAHQEFNNPSIKNELINRISSGKDIFYRGSNNNDVQEFYYDNMLITDLNIYPEKMINLIKEKYNYLIK
jgi:beta-1,4-mannosyl-glycoprotein beta-1,4-N-acetylglucosaminyltransferase